jgi:hypothetical protein
LSENFCAFANHSMPQKLGYSFIVRPPTRSTTETLQCLRRPERNLQVRHQTLVAKVSRTQELKLIMLL